MEAVATTVRTKETLAGKVGQLRARLAQERARALERRASANEVAQEIERSERERGLYAERLRREARGPCDHAVIEDVELYDEGALRQWGRAAVAGDGETNGDETFAGPLRVNGSSERTERKGDLLGKIEAETLALRQRAAAAKVQEEGMRAKAAQKEVTAKATLEEALIEGNTLKQDTEKREVCFLYISSMRFGLVWLRQCRLA